MKCLVLLLLLLLLFYTLGRYIPEGFEKKIEKKLTNRYDTQSAQSNASKQSWSRTALKRCNNTERERKHVSLASPELLEILWPNINIIVVVVVVLGRYIPDKGKY